MPRYAALIYSRDVDWSQPEYNDVTAEYGEFMAAAGDIVQGGAALYQTSTATTVRVEEKGGDLMTTDGPYAETKEALTGFYLLDCDDLDHAIAVAATIPGAWDGAIEVRPVIDFGRS